MTTQEQTPESEKTESTITSQLVEMQASEEASLPPADTAPEEEGTTDLAPQSEAFSILILELDPEVTAQYVALLQTDPAYKIKAVKTAEEALEYLSAEGPQTHLILFNWEVEAPHTSGYLFAQKLRHEAAFDHIEILVHSDVLTEEDTFLMVELDIHHISKQNALKELQGAVQNIKGNYYKVNNTVSTLKKIEHLLHKNQIEDVSPLIALPEIQTEITTNPRYVHLMAEWLMINKEYEKAVNFLKEFFDKNKDVSGAENLKSLTTLGKALCFLKRFDEALLVFKNLESKSPKNLGHKILVGDALVEMEAFETAKEKYEQVLDMEAGYQEGLEGMVKTSIAQGEMEEAKSFFQQMKNPLISPTFASFFNNRGVALVYNGQIQDAIVFFENALQFLEEKKGIVYFNLGLAYMRSEDYPSAVNCFEQALASQEAKLLAQKAMIKEFKAKGKEAFLNFYQTQKSLSA